MRRDARLLVVLVMLAIWGLITHGTFAGTGDAPHYLMIAHSLAFDGDLDLTNDYRDASLIGDAALAREAHALERGGRLRPLHDVGMPLLFAPVVRVAYPLAGALNDRLPARVLQAARLNGSVLLRHELSLIMALLTGLLARELWLLMRTLDPAGRPFGWALLFALTPPILSHAFVFFTEIPTALGALVVFRRLTIAPIRGAGAAALAGTFAGFLWLIHVRNVGLVAGLLLVAAAAARQRRISTMAFAAFAAAALAMILVRTAVTYSLWGTLLSTPHAAVGTPSGMTATAREIFVRATGLLFDREYGLFAYAPIYLLAFPGLLRLWRTGRDAAWPAAIVLACYLLPILLPVTNVQGWAGGWSPAARFLVPVAPLLWLCVFAYAAAAVRAGRWIVTALVVLQVVIDAYVWQFPKTLWNDGDGISRFAYAQWMPSWTDQNAALPFAIALCAALAGAYVCAQYLKSTERRAASP